MTHIDSRPTSKTLDAIYVLGGSQGSLKPKFDSVAALYHEGICQKVLILSRPGITEYSNLFGRNLTNDEWAILQLEELGIAKNNIEPIYVKEEFFGTLTEAKNISRLAKNRGYKDIILVSSPYHTHRVKISFEKFLKDHDATFYVQGSGEKASFGQLITEFIKFKMYQCLLLF